MAWPREPKDERRYTIPTIAWAASAAGPARTRHLIASWRGRPV